MVRLSCVVALSCLLAACHTPNAPGDVAATLVPEHALYTLSPDSSFATVSFGLRITNTSYRTAKITLCRISLEQRPPDTGKFNLVYRDTCEWESSGGAMPFYPEILAQQDTVISVSIRVAKASAFKGIQYRVGLFASFDPAFDNEIRLTSRSFEPALD